MSLDKYLIACPYCSCPLKQISDKDFYRNGIYGTCFVASSFTLSKEKAFLCENSDLPVFIAFETYSLINDFFSYKFDSVSVYYKISSSCLLECTNLYQATYSTEFFINKLYIQDSGTLRYDDIYSIESNINKHLTLEQVETIVNFS